MGHLDHPFPHFNDAKMSHFALMHLHRCFGGEREGDNPFILLCPRLSFELWPCVRVWYIPLKNRSTLETIQANCKQNNDEDESQRTNVGI